MKINTLHNPAKGWRPATWKTAFRRERKSAQFVYINNNTHTALLSAMSSLHQAKESVYIIIIITARVYTVTDAAAFSLGVISIHTASRDQTNRAAFCELGRLTRSRSRMCTQWVRARANERVHHNGSRGDLLFAHTPPSHMEIFLTYHFQYNQIFSCSNNNISGAAR